MGHIGIDEAAVLADLYPSLRQFAGVVAPWHEDPDDVLHAALVAVLRAHKLAELQDPGRYIRSAIINVVRTNHRRATTRLRLVEKLGRPDSVQEHYPSDVAVLAALSPVERAVIYLHDIEGLPFDEVASMVGIRAGAARVAASRGRKRLRDRIEQEERT